MEKENLVTIKYKFKDDYNPIYINGAYGGVNTQGEIVVNFYFERLPLPNTAEIDTSNNQISKQEPVDLDKSLVRFIQNGVVMNLDTAKQIHSWLGGQIENLEKILNKEDNE